MNYNSISINNLSYKYPSAGNWSLQEINLQIPQGSFFTLIGPSGSGKSTLLLLMRGFYQEIGGEIKGKIIVDKQNVSQTPIGELGKIIGIVFQNPALQLHQPRVIDEVASAPMYQGLPYEECLRRATTLIDKILGKDFYYRSPQELSAGQQQRVAVAASLALDAKVLLLDEPFSFLDETARYNLLNVINNLRLEGKTIIMATHDIGLVSKISTHMALINDGRVVTSGITKEILYSEQLEAVMPPPLFVQLVKKTGVEGKPLSWNEVLPKLLVSKQPLTDTSRKKTKLSLTNVSFNYPDSKNGVKNINLNIGVGEIVGLIGHNGSGKTTLAKIIIGLIKPRSGKIYLDEKDITKTDVTGRARSIGYSTQDPLDMFFESNLWDEVAAGPRLLGLPEPKELAETALKQYGLWKYKDVHPDSISGGEKSRLGLADITVSDPSVLLLDEPEFGLDPKNWNKITKHLLKLKDRGKTIVMITQDLEAALFLCDKLVLLKEGQIVKIAPAPEILSDESLMSKCGLAPLSFSSLVKPFKNRLTVGEFINSVRLRKR